MSKRTVDRYTGETTASLSSIIKYFQTLPPETEVLDLDIDYEYRYSGAKTVNIRWTLEHDRTEENN